MPESFKNYYEPFVGGGALYFDLNPQVALINDINASLINAYIQIRDNLDELTEKLDKIDNDFLRCGDQKAYYYEIRDAYNSRLESNSYDAATAAQFIYINKHCFNGLYRVNSKGKFNVPFNNSKRASYALENLVALSKVLTGTIITNADFEETCQDAHRGDFVFFDSPYAPINPTSFESYTKEGFSKEEHIRLSRLFKELSDRGCFCMLTNHNTSFIRELYEDFNIDVVSARRSINSDASKRTGTEVIITNY